MKQCRICGVEKPLGDFHKKSTSRDGRCGACKKCEIARLVRRRKERMEADPAYADQVRRWQRDRRRRLRDDRYGLPQGTVDSMLEAQGGRCAVCARTADEVACAGKSGEQLHVDHDHETGVVRGLLCKKCNSALGLLDDDVERIVALAEYLLVSQPERIAA